jgi:hypothetical protein
MQLKRNNLLNTVWRKSARSSANGCVEVAMLGNGTVAVRDSKDRPSPVLSFTPREWRVFIEGAQAGEFDLPDAAS